MPNRLGAIESYALYYGMGGEDQLSGYDLAIVDPAGRTAEGVKRLKARGAKAYAYISVLEVPQAAGEPPPDSVLTDGGEPQANAMFHNWVLDPRSPRTRQRLLGLAEQFLALGHDGLFLDTMADVEDMPFAPGLAAELLPATGELVYDLARRSGCGLVQNRGFRRLLALTVAHVDAVCWEAFPYQRIGLLPSLQPGIRVMRKLRKEHGLTILALNEGLRDVREHRAARAACRRAGFLWYGTSSYTALPTTLAPR